MLLDSIENKEKILEKFLKISAFEGWNDNALKQAVKECEIEEKFSNLIFENGCLDLAEFYIEKQNKKLSEKIAKIDNFYSKKIRDKIRTCLYLRFEIEQENKIALQRLSNFYLNPKNLCSLELGIKPTTQAIKSCFQISDCMWKLINDQSTDFNFYTKRMTLAKIILRSFIIFLKDDSKSLEKTKSVIDDEIDGVMKFEKRKAKIKNLSNQAKDSMREFLIDENGLIKKPKEVLKNLPFIRLFK